MQSNVPFYTPVGLRPICSLSRNAYALSPVAVDVDRECTNTGGGIRCSQTPDSRRTWRTCNSCATRKSLHDSFTLSTIPHHHVTASPAPPQLSVPLPEGILRHSIKPLFPHFSSPTWQTPSPAYSIPPSLLILKASSKRRLKCAMLSRN